MATVKDPICGKDVDTLRARAVGIFGGQTFYFCSQDCKSKYVDPRKGPRPEVKKPEPAPQLQLKKPELKKPPEAKKPAEPKTEAKPEPKKPEAKKADPPPEPKPARKDPSFEELPPMVSEPAGGDLDLPDLTPVKPVRNHSPSVMAELGDLKKESRRWAVIIVILAALVLAAVVLSLRN
jgi:YHS domain-containing protein